MMSPDGETRRVDLAGVIHRVWTTAMGGWFITSCGVHYEDLDRPSQKFHTCEPSGRITDAPLNCFFCLASFTPQGTCAP